MKNKIIFLSLIIFKSYLYAQEKQSKPTIDTTAIHSWPSLGGAKISNNGKFVAHTIENLPIGSRTLFLVSSDGKWNKEIPNSSDIFQCIITEDSKYAVYPTQNDTICVTTLGTPSVDYISNVKSFKAPAGGDGTWLAYQTNDLELIVKNLKSGDRQIFTGVTDYYFDINGKTLIIKCASDNKHHNDILIWVSLSSKKQSKFWQGANAENICFDNAGTQVAFTSEINSNNGSQKTLFHYANKELTAKLLKTDESLRLDTNFILYSIIGFSNDGKRLFVQLGEKEAASVKGDFVKVNIWSYFDDKLQSEQLKKSPVNTFKAVIDINSNKIARIQLENEVEISSSEDWVLYKQAVPNKYPNALSTILDLASISLVSTTDGRRIKIKENISDNTWVSFRLSPDNKNIVYYDKNKRSFFTYEIMSGRTFNITHEINTKWTRYVSDKPSMKDVYTYPVSGWIEVKGSIEYVLLNDQYDIWLVPLKGKMKARNITNKYGGKNEISFEVSDANNKNTFNINENIILNSFNRKNKTNGFYKINISKNFDPIELSSGNYIYEIHDNGYVPPRVSFSPLKAKKDDSYLVRRMSAKNSPNYFTTSDFKGFVKISNVNPESRYNWLSSELHTWKSADGKNLQGILYKPENFDSLKKYPLIFNYYEKKSDGLNAYHIPRCEPCNINIPDYVSNGYLVFTPDAYYEIGRPGEGIYNSIISAADYLSKFSFVNSKRMGIQGCSFGGWETNYLIAHSKIFSAACSASGITNFISGYGSIGGEGRSLQAMYELSFWRMGLTIWDDPQRYIDNSPVFKLNQVETPLLIMATSFDGVCPFSQAIELFTGLRRLNKKVWLLEYEDGNHGLTGAPAEDFSIRMRQFFDHYLKDAPPPEWMTKGRSANLRGIDNRLRLDHSGAKP